jgi:hypothetical protein
LYELSYPKNGGIKVERDEVRSPPNAVCDLPCGFHSHNRVIFNGPLYTADHINGFPMSDDDEPHVVYPEDKGHNKTTYS